MRDTKVGAKLRKIIEIAPLSAFFAGVNVVCEGALRDIQGGGFPWCVMRARGSVAVAIGDFASGPGGAGGYMEGYIGIMI